MSPPPVNPKIYHITHVENLPSILAVGFISSDAQRIRQNLENTNLDAVSDLLFILKQTCIP